MNASRIAHALGLATIVSVATGCGDSPAPGTISGGTLSGKILSKAWTFAAGTATCNANTNTCLIRAFAVDFAACSATPEADEFRIWNLPNAVGNYDLDTMLSVSFLGRDGIDVYTGKVSVYAITANNMTIGANTAVDPVDMTGTYVSGKCQVPVCP